MVRFHPFFLLILCFSFFGGPDVKAGDTLKGCFIEWAPYTQLRDGQPYGITVDVVEEAARRANFDLTLSLLPWKRCLKLVERGDMDFAMEAVDRPGFIHGKHPSALYIEAFWHRESEDYGQFENLQQLVDKRLALMQGYQYSDALLNAGFKRIDWVISEKNAAELVSKKRLDIVYADVIVMQHVVSKTGFRLKPLLPVLNTQPLYPTFHMNFSEKRDRLDRALGMMHKDGTVDQIYKKHTGSSFADFADLGQFSPIN